MRINNRGFTLLEIIIAVTVVAIMAAAITPMAYKEIMRAREEATLGELQAIKNGLEEFFADTGRFPTEGEGLTALVNDPGVTGWSGPYVGGSSQDPASEVLDDAFGENYLYDLSPTTNPAGAADVLVASGGSDQSITFGSVGNTWTIAGNGDDILVLVSQSALNRDKTLLTQQRMQVIGEAVRAYYADNSAFPATFSDLTGQYMDAGINSEALKDPWNFSFTMASDGGTPPVMTITSRGPNQADNSGAGDDIILQISSVPPGRTTTLRRLDVAQNALNNDAAATLSGTWATDLATLGLSSAFENDGWGQTFQVNTASRVVYSRGPDNDPNTISDNIPKGVGP